MKEKEKKRWFDNNMSTKKNAVAGRIAMVSQVRSVKLEDVVALGVCIKALKKIHQLNLPRTSIKQWNEHSISQPFTGQLFIILFRGIHMSDGSIRNGLIFQQSLLGRFSEISEYPDDTV